VTARRDMDTDVAFRRLGASLGVVEHLLRLAVLVHRYCHHFLLNTHHTVASYQLAIITDQTQAKTPVLFLVLENERFAAIL